jgi:formylglycine-generating enzyme required for sulfatase activity
MRGLVMVKMISCPALGKAPNAFLIGQTQVTQADWEKVMGDNPSSQKGALLPVHRVSWFECVKFCNKLSELEGLDPAYEVRSSYDEIGNEYEPEVTLIIGAKGYRLPTEAEWEYAAKAGGEFKYSGSDTLDEVAWHDGNSGYEIHPVALKEANAWGIYDMSGNVWEWCNDEWDNEPSTPFHGDKLRVIKGGCWGSDGENCLVSTRYGLASYARERGTGLRLCRTDGIV